MSAVSFGFSKTYEGSGSGLFRRKPTMPRHFFDFHDGVTIIDEEGVELENIDAARICAIQSLSAIAGDDTSLEHMNTLKIIVRNDVGIPVLTANLTLTTAES